MAAVPATRQRSARILPILLSYRPFRAAHFEGLLIEIEIARLPGLDETAANISNDGRIAFVREGAELTTQLARHDGAPHEIQAVTIAIDARPRKQ